MLGRSCSKVSSDNSAENECRVTRQLYNGTILNNRSTFVGYELLNSKRGLS